MNENKVKQVLQNFDGLGVVKSVKRYPGGAINDSYKVITSTGIFSLRVYKNRSLGRIKTDIRLLESLTGLPTPKLVKVRGKYLFMVGEKWAVLYKYIPGKSVNKPNKKQLEQVGKFLALFHKKSKKIKWQGPKDKFYYLPDKKINKYLSIVRRTRTPNLDYLPRIVRELRENRLSNKLPKGPIHVDVKPENVLFSGDKLTGVIDFDNAYVGPLILDLAKSLVWFGRSKKGFHPEHLLPLFKGYIKRRPLNSLEYRELYKAVKFAFLSHVFVDYFMYAIGKTKIDYFKFITGDFYQSYKTFQLSETEFYHLLC